MTTQAQTQAQPHISVMLNEVLAALAPKDGEVYVDGTFGAGGYTRAILEAAECTVIAIDRDITAIERGAALKQHYGDRLILIHGRFGDALDLLREAGFESVDGFVLDLGVSSMQFDQAQRGFSFRFDGPLDMRMDGTSGDTAADIVNHTPEKELADIIYQYGEERCSRRVAHKIAEARQVSPITTTAQLAELVRTTVPKSGKDGIDPATRTFQALRIAVNDELGELERALAGAEEFLTVGGRLVVVSFHSLEDGIVKRFLTHKTGRDDRGSRHLPQAKTAASLPSFTVPHRKPVLPSETEIRANPRSRSAKLRVAVKAGAA